jgi:hypothetical protein
MILEKNLPYPKKMEEEMLKKKFIICLFIVKSIAIYSLPWITFATLGFEYISGDPSMDVSIDTKEILDNIYIDINITNNDENRILKYIKIKIDRTILEGYVIKRYDPEPQKEVEWGPFHFTFKYKESIQIAPGEATHLKIYIEPKNYGIYKGEIEVHALKGDILRFKPFIGVIVLQNK